MGPAERTRNESVPKIITNHTKKLFLNCNRQFGNSKKSVTVFRPLSDKKKLLPYILFRKYIYISALETADQGNRHCADCIGTLSFPVGRDGEGQAPSHRGVLVLRFG